MLMAISVRPAPMSPANPTTSPLLRLNDTLFTMARDSFIGSNTVRPSTLSISSPGEVTLHGKRSSISRPTMLRIRRSSSISLSLFATVSITLPSRSIVMASATRVTSFSLCEMRIEVTPCAFRSTRSSRSLQLSSSFSAAVGSSRISSLTFFDNAFAISTSCCLPTPRLEICV